MNDEVPQIVVPRPSEVKPYKTPDVRVHEVVKEIYGPTVELEPPRKHDPWWRERLWSVQNARDQAEMKKFGFWSVIGVLYLIAQFGWLFAGYVAKWL